MQYARKIAPKGFYLLRLDFSNPKHIYLDFICILSDFQDKTRDYPKIFIDIRMKKLYFAEVSLD